uniref:Uncharacterized protein n=1 Tax=Opuntia streptacantha TaxID=393608 RepID=A0A7C8ZS26_OPUST
MPFFVQNYTEHGPLVQQSCVPMHYAISYINENHHNLELGRTLVLTCWLAHRPQVFFGHTWYNRSILLVFALLKKGTSRHQVHICCISGTIAPWQIGITNLNRHQL